MTVTTVYLAQFGITMQEAHDFVWAHIDNPQLILTTASQYGVTTTMLGEIAGGYSAIEVRGFFAEHGLDATPLDDTGGVAGGYYESAPGAGVGLVAAAPMTYDLMGY